MRFPLPLLPLLLLAQAAPPPALDPLRQAEARLRALAPRVEQATVAITFPDAPGTIGSGVVVSEDGFVLTVAHVAGAPGRKAVLVFADGSRAEAQTLGANALSDCALLKITPKEGAGPPRKFACLPLALSAGALQPGAWVMAAGHSGGFNAKRGVALHAGRLVARSQVRLETECPLAVGDSGGPLVDEEGRVVGLHWAVGGEAKHGFHVACDAVRRNMARMRKSERIAADATTPDLGAEFGDESHGLGAFIMKVAPSSPAEKAGLRAGDVVTEVGPDPLRNAQELAQVLLDVRPGEALPLRILRGGQVGQGRIVPGEAKADARDLGFVFGRRKDTAELPVTRGISVKP
jgi:serine protease Do